MRAGEVCCSLGLGFESKNSGLEGDWGGHRAELLVGSEKIMAYRSAPQMGEAVHSTLHSANSVYRGFRQKLTL